MTPKLGQNKMSDLRETQKIKAVQLHKWTPKQFLNQTQTPKIAHQGPKKTKMTPKLSQNEKLELKKTWKIKDVLEYNKDSPLGPQKVKKLSQNQMSELKIAQKMKVVQLHEQTPKQFVNPSPTPKIVGWGPKK